MAAVTNGIDASEMLPLIPMANGLAVKEDITLETTISALKKLDARDKATKASMKGNLLYFTNGKCALCCNQRFTPPLSLCGKLVCMSGGKVCACEAVGLAREAKKSSCCAVFIVLARCSTSSRYLERQHGISPQHRQYSTVHHTQRAVQSSVKSRSCQTTPQAGQYGS